MGQFLFSVAKMKYADIGYRVHVTLTADLKMVDLDWNVYVLWAGG